jgi:pimeloyl-ACP methyl ester carboxylesterase
MIIQNRLDCRLLIRGAEENRDWIVYSNANGVCYEHILAYTQFLSTVFNRNVCVYNYSGVGYSRGESNSAKHLLDDLEMIVTYLQKEKGMESLVLWGHSIGGAVSILCAAERLVGKKKGLKKLKIVADRSFADLSQVVREKLGLGPLAPVITGLLGASLTAAGALFSMLSFGVLPWSHLLEIAKNDESSLQTADILRGLLCGLSLGWVGLRFGSSQTHRLVIGGFLVQMALGNLSDSLPLALILSFTLAFECGFRGWSFAMLESLVSGQGWIMQPAQSLKKLAKIPVIVTFHPEDEMILQEFSLAKANLETGHISIELEGPTTMGGNNNHMYELNLHELEQIKAILDTEVDEEDEPEAEEVETPKGKDD